MANFDRTLKFHDLKIGNPTHYLTNMYINNVIASYHNFTYQIFCRFGCPKIIIISDQGHEFVNEVSKHLFSKTQTQHRVTSAYHPQTNGLTERFNQTLSFSLIAKINEDQSNWDMLLDLILFSYRVTRQSSTKYSPYIFYDVWSSSKASR